MAKIEIPIRVYMGKIEEIINELKHLQTYKLFEGDDKVLINRDDVIKIFANHLCTEILSGTQQRLFKHKKVEEKNEEMSKVSEMEMAYGEYLND